MEEGVNYICLGKAHKFQPGDLVRDIRTDEILQINECACLWIYDSEEIYEDLNSGSLYYYVVSYFNDGIMLVCETDIELIFSI